MILCSFSDNFKPSPKIQGQRFNTRIPEVYMRQRAYIITKTNKTPAMTHSRVNVGNIGVPHAFMFYYLSYFFSF